MIETVFVVGASGRVGAQVTQHLAEKGYHVYAGARYTDHLPKDDHITPVTLDIASISLEALTELFKEKDAVIFTAGSRSQNLLQVDAFGAVKAMQAAEDAHVSRFVLLSSLYALEPERWSQPPFDQLDEPLTDFNIAKFFADRYLIDNTTLDYTILQPSFLIEGDYTGHITTQVEKEANYQNTIPDVAMTLVEILSTPKTINRVIKMSGGPTPIKEALEQ